jgi:hypothetical protein
MEEYLGKIICFEFLQGCKIYEGLSYVDFLWKTYKLFMTFSQATLDQNPLAFLFFFPIFCQR